MKSFELLPFSSADELAHAVADEWMNEIEAANRESKPYCVALSGGRVAQNLFPAVAEKVRIRDFWGGDTPSLPANVHFFWSDERCVPPDNPDSNFRLAQKLLFVPLKITGAQIHRIQGEMSPESAAAQATSEICGIAPLNADGQPVLDLVLLGMGEDGHVASLFPGEPEAVISSNAVYRAVKNSPKPPPDRITLGYAAIAAARQVWVLISGAGKGTALRESLLPTGKNPLGRLIQSCSNTRLFKEFSQD